MDGFQASIKENTNIQETSLYFGFVMMRQKKANGGRKLSLFRMAGDEEEFLIGQKIKIIEQLDAPRYDLVRKALAS